MEDGSVSVSNWLKFFKDAEIPAGLGANYAVIFCDHRIRKEILGDLSKDILVEMGIKAMGDIIAILKQAKVVAEQVTRENTSKLLETKTKSNSISSKTNSSKPSTPATRMISHSINSKDFSKPLTPERKALEDVATEKSVFSRLGQDSPSAESCGVFKRLGDPVVSTTTNELPYAGVLKKGSPESEKKATKKVIKLKSDSKSVPIKITTSITTKSAGVKRKSVLDRLGPATPKQTQPVVKRTISTKSSKTKSVLQRSGKGLDSSSDEEEPVKKKVARSGPKIIRLAPSSRPKQLPAKTSQTFVKQVVSKTVSIKKPSNVMSRLGNKVSSTSEKVKKPLSIKRTLAMDSTSAPTTIKKRVLARPQQQKPKVPILRLRVPLKRKSPSSRPISSDHVSSTTSAGIFKGEASSSASSVFSRLGAK